MCFLAPDAMLGSTNRKCLRIYIAIPICTFFLTQQIGTNLHYACKNQWTLPWKVQALRESCNLDATVTFTPWRNPALMALHSRNVQGNLTKFLVKQYKLKKGQAQRQICKTDCPQVAALCPHGFGQSSSFQKKKTDNLWPNFEWNPISLKKMQIKICQTTVFAWWAESLVEEQARNDKDKIFQTFLLYVDATVCPGSLLERFFSHQRDWNLCEVALLACFSRQNQFSSACQNMVKATRTSNISCHYSN